MASTSTLRVAFVGAGYMASEHLRAFAACPEVESIAFSKALPLLGPTCIDSQNNQGDNNYIALPIFYFSSQ